MTDPFIIFTLPRSRSAWLSHWLSYIKDGNRVKAVGHDAFSRCGTIEECEELFTREENRLDGTVETGAAFAYKTIVARMPKARLLVVQRDPTACFESLRRQGVVADHDDWIKRIMDIYAVSAAGVRTVAYQDLVLESCARWVWDYCLGLPWDGQWWAEWDHTNVQVDMKRRMEELKRDAPNIERLKAEVANAG